MDRGKRIIAVCQPLESSAQGLVRGTVAYARQHALDWQVVYDPGMQHAVRPRVDGLVGGLDDTRILDLQAQGIACVSLKHNREGLPCVISDDVAIGRKAAEFLLERGYQSISTYLNRVVNRPHYEVRRKAFIDHLQTRARSCDQFQPLAGDASQEVQRRHLGEWMRSRSGPVAMFIPMERAAMWFLSECLAVGLVLGRDYAVVGCQSTLTDDLGNLPIPTRLAVPMSVVGWNAALLLHRQFSGDRGPFRRVVVPPVLEVHDSTPDLLAVDPVVRAMRMAAGSDGPIRLARLARSAKLSLVQFQRRFTAATGCPPAQWLREQRLQRAAQRLLDGEDAIERVSHLAGFSHPTTFAAAFRKRYGASPTLWRMAGSGLRPAGPPGAASNTDHAVRRTAPRSR